MADTPRKMLISEAPTGALTAESPWTLCGQCDHGVVWLTIRCTCDPGPEGQHHPYCGAEPCPNGCFEQLRGQKLVDRAGNAPVEQSLTLPRRPHDQP